jgi:cardiolipin synthase C
LTLSPPGHPRTLSTAFEGFASTRLGQFFGLAADQHPGLSGFSLLSHGREAIIVRLALADLAERSLDMQYYMWNGDTTGRIVVDHGMKAANRGVRVRLLVDDPYYKDSDSIKACLDAHEARTGSVAYRMRSTPFDGAGDIRGRASLAE